MKSKLYPLNFPIAEFTRRLITSGGLSVKGILLLFVYYLKLILVMPVAFLQYMFFSKKIRQTQIAKPPVFILGHYRSGTTYLHKLIAGDTRFGFISYYDIICPNTSLLFGNWLKAALQLIINKLKIKTSFFNNTIPSLDDPAEEERFLINKGSAYTDYWRFVFPLCWNQWPSCAKECLDEEYYQPWSKEYEYALKLATYKSKGKQLVLKSPPNTERIKYLLKMFPDAKFIYISRNPYHVFYSMQNLWQKAIKKFCLQHISDEQVEEIIFSHFINLIDQYEKDKVLIPEGHLVEITYEELEAKPLFILKKIYKALNIHGFETMYDSLQHQLQREKRYSKFKYNFNQESFKKIEKRWTKYIHQWNEKRSGFEINDFENRVSLLSKSKTVQECDPEMNSGQAATLRLNAAMKGEL